MKRRRSAAYLRGCKANGRIRGLAESEDSTALECPGLLRGSAPRPVQPVVGNILPLLTRRPTAKEPRAMDTILSTAGRKNGAEGP